MVRIEGEMKALGRVGHGPGLYALGCGHLALQEPELEALCDRDPAKQIEEVISACAKAIECNPLPHVNIALAYRIGAEAGRERGRDPSEDLSKARLALQTSLSIKPDFFESYVRLADVELTAARWALRSPSRGPQPSPLGKRGAPEAFLRKADLALDRAESLNSRSGSVYLKRAEVCLLCADALSSASGPEEDTREKGLNATGRALSLDPALAEAAAVRGELYLREARGEHYAARRDRAAASARESFTRAFQINPLLSRLRGPGPSRGGSDPGSGSEPRREVRLGLVARRSAHPFGLTPASPVSYSPALGAGLAQW